MNQTRSLFSALALVTLVCSAIGCNASQDKHKLVSTAYEPKNVVVVDGLTGDVLWERQIPVGDTLKIDFEDHQMSPELTSQRRGPSSRMYYEQVNTLSGNLLEKGTVEMVGQPRLQWTLRPVERPASRTQPTRVPPATAATQPGGR